ncbi:hypothetical protein E4U19_003297 [Claviceps sp. Clav32 group G5]|nr:hypothetical protein E4U19_003297 [Claviceps sp. Clav32 group G5]
MQFLSALFLAAAASVASGAVIDSAHSSDLKARNDDWRWCNQGTAGDRGCEALGHHTYCCSMSASPTDAFKFHRNVIVASKNPKHGTDSKLDTREIVGVIHVCGMAKGAKKQTPAISSPTADGTVTSKEVGEAMEKVSQRVSSAKRASRRRSCSYLESFALSLGIGIERPRTQSWRPIRRFEEYNPHFKVVRQVRDDGSASPSSHPESFLPSRTIQKNRSW